MKFYLLFTFIFLTISIATASIPYAFSATGQNNTVSFYEKNCNNDHCVTTTCYTGQPCSKVASNITESNVLKQLSSNPSIDSGLKNFDFFGLLKNAINLR
jgi:hypothetical protein